MSTSLNLTCYFPAERPVSLFMTISPDAHVLRLEMEILKELRSQGQKDVDSILLYTADMEFPGALHRKEMQSYVLQWLHGQPMNSELETNQRLSSIFSSDPDISKSKVVDIIIATPEMLEMHDTLGEPFKKEIDRCLDACLSLPSPSESAKDASKLKEVFGGDDCRIHIGRPGGFPAVIFHPALAALKNQLDHLEGIRVNLADITIASTYIKQAIRFYDDDPAREVAIRTYISTAIGQTDTWKRPNIYLLEDPAQKGGKVVPNCSWSYGKFIVTVLELKNSLGIAGDAFSQAIVDYCKIVAGNEYKPFRMSSNFPMVLIAVTGNRLEVGVAVSVGTIYTSKLLTLDVSLGFHSSDNIIRLARVFKALSTCREALEDYYARITTTALSSSMFPNPIPIDPSVTLPDLIYRQYFTRGGQPSSALMDLGNVTTVMYLADLKIQDQVQEVIVKFTTRYNEQAHCLLAEANLAPTLHFCGCVVGDLYMVVMDRVKGKTLWQLSQARQPPPISQNILKKVKEAVQLLHEQDIVFGDLRSNNIICVDSESGDMDSAVLVDFDWAGKDGESRYPVILNPCSKWAPGVEPYGIMLKAHDLWQLEQLERH